MLSLGVPLLQLLAFNYRLLSPAAANPSSFKQAVSVVTIIKNKHMKRLYPTTIVEEINGEPYFFENTRKVAAKGKKGETQKGLLKKIRAAKRQGKDTTELAKLALAIPVHECGVCHACFRYGSQLSYHHERDHKEPKHYTRLITPGIGYVCKVCGDNSTKFADGRALKRHYRDRKIHKARDLVDAGVKLWARISSNMEDMAVVRDVYYSHSIIQLAPLSDTEGLSIDGE